MGLPRRPSIPLVALLLAGCSCSGTVLVGGERPYARCHADPSPAREPLEVAGRTLTVEGRRLTVEGLPTPYRIAAFRGHADMDGAALREADAHLGIWLGGLGDDPEEAAARLASAASTGLPVLFLAGGEDRRDVLRAAFAAEGTGGVVDVTTLRSVVAGPLELLPVAGSPDGTYVRGEDGCGVSAGELSSWNVPSPAEGTHRVLFAWASPSGPDALAEGLAGVDAGFDAMAELAERLEVPGGLFAWPSHQAGLSLVDGAEPSGPSFALRTILTPIAGPEVILADGGRARPGIMILEVSAAGLRRADRP